jgi:N-acetylglutamate synthase/N-acetylornithine aminotransferase
MRRDAFEITMTLGAGRHDATIRTCDLGVDYVRFNSGYSS